MENAQNIFEVGFDKDNNTFDVFYLGQNRIETCVLVTDIDSKHGIYFTDWGFEDYGRIYVMPIPIHALNRYNRLGYFRGYEIHFYTQDKTKLLESHVIWYNEFAPHKERIMIESNPWNLTWINYTEMFIENFYNPLEMHISGVCLDFGANDGLYTEYLLQNGANKVYAVECDPRSAKFLEKKYNDHPKVVVVEKAVWKENLTDVKLSYRYQTSTTSSLKDWNNYFSENDYYLVNTWNYKTLLEKMNIPKVDFLKMDIESAEYEVFSGMTNDELSNISGLMVEIHDNTNGRIYEITDRLESLGFAIELRNHIGDNEIISDKAEWQNYPLCTFYAKK